MKVEEEETSAMENDPTYVNKDVYWKNRSSQLESEIRNAEQQVNIGIYHLL